MTLYCYKKILGVEDMKEYDYLIVGAGLFGSIFAYEMNKIGKKCLIIEKRNHIGGNIYTEEKEGINVHKYGAHIFHVDDKKIWEYINQFADLTVIPIHQLPIIMEHYITYHST